MSTRHEPVLLDEIVDVLARRPEGPASPRLVDCTLGGGGHAAALLAACPGSELLGLDRDAAAIERCGVVLAPFAGRVSLVNDDYRRLAGILEKKGGRALSGPSSPISVSRASSSTIRSEASPSGRMVLSTCATTPIAVVPQPSSSRMRRRRNWSPSSGGPTNRTRDASLGRSSMAGGGVR